MPELDLSSIPSTSRQFDTSVPLSTVYPMPKYSAPIQHLLEEKRIHEDWNKFVEETAYHVLLHPTKFRDRGDFAEFGRLMCGKYPCIKRRGRNPWVSTCMMYLISYLHFYYKDLLKLEIMLKR